MQGFLTDSGDVNLDRVQLIMSDLGDAEDEIFKKRQQNELAFKQREKDKKRRNEIISNFKPKWIPTGQFAPNVSFDLIILILCTFIVYNISSRVYSSFNLENVSSHSFFKSSKCAIY